ncbi:thioredoxin family protein [Lentibacillus daqui]|uniref:thioredoxin family protein n=1 Tax=Lentibacillus daqui TaxID=2911514 RepID=UPI0022B19867|nr:thioredoxin family protein [Lentibacillus daqui]
MQQFTEEAKAKESYFLYIFTPLCGTCKLARTMLDKIESVHQENIFYEMNASINPEFMQEYKIESVPCLFIKQDGKIKERVYAFRSIANIYHYLLEYKPELFATS